MSPKEFPPRILVSVYYPGLPLTVRGLETRRAEKPCPDHTPRHRVRASLKSYLLTLHPGLIPWHHSGLWRVSVHLRRREGTLLKKQRDDVQGCFCNSLGSQRACDLGLRLISGSERVLGKSAIITAMPADKIHTERGNNKQESLSLKVHCLFHVWCKSNHYAGQPWAYRALSIISEQNWEKNIF